MEVITSIGNISIDNYELRLDQIIRYLKTFNTPKSTFQTLHLVKDNYIKYDDIGNVDIKYIVVKYLEYLDKFRSMFNKEHENEILYFCPDLCIRYEDENKYRCSITDFNLPFDNESIIVSEETIREFIEMFQDYICDISNIIIPPYQGGFTLGIKG